VLAPDPDEPPYEAPIDPSDDGEPADVPARRPRLDEGLRDLVILMLAEGQSLAAIEEATGVARQQVAEIRDAEGMKPSDVEKQGKERELYRAHLIKNLSVQARAERLAFHAKNANPAISLRAIEMADEISQVSATSNQPPALVPIFALPKGTRVPVRKL